MSSALLRLPPALWSHESDLIDDIVIHQNPRPLRTSTFHFHCCTFPSADVRRSGRGVRRGANVREQSRAFGTRLKAVIQQAALSRSERIEPLSCNTLGQKNRYRACVKKKTCVSHFSFPVSKKSKNLLLDHNLIRLPRVEFKMQNNIIYLYY